MVGSSPLSAANRVSDSKISVSNSFYLSLMVPWMEVDSEIYDRWLWTARNWAQQLLYLMYQKCLATRRKITHSKLLTMLNVFKIETTASLIHSYQHMTYIKNVRNDYDYINKKLHFWWWYFLYSTHTTDTLKRQHCPVSYNSQHKKKTTF